MQSVATGYLRPPSSWQLRQRYYAVPLTLPAGQTVQLHVRVQTDGSHHAPLSLWDAASFEAESGAENLWLGMAYGILLAMAGLNLMVGLWSRERVYLLYVDYIVSITLLQIWVNGYLTKTLGAAQSLLDIINDVLDLSKIEAGKLTVEQTLFDLNEVLDNLSGLMNLKAADKGPELLFSVESGVPYALMGDPLRLWQVLINLTNNAIKFTDKGQIVVRISLIEKTDRDCCLRFSITDSGIGLSEAQIARLFESYNQADTSTTRKYGGTDLGLAICKRLVELMGGDIRVSSVPGQGSTFEFTVRMGLSDSALRTQLLELTQDLTRLRVLVVDDNSIARDILRSYQ